MLTLTNSPYWRTKAADARNLHTQEVQRIKRELQAAGMTRFGRLKFASRFLPQILHEDEHVRGIVYGRYAEGTGLLKWTEGMLVATDYRVVFLDRKPGFEALDELTYDVISGVQKSYAWPFAAMTLHTRIGDYTFRFANKRCIDTFMRYVEKRHLESVATKDIPVQPGNDQAFTLNETTITFLTDHDTAVLSTVDHVGNTYGVTVHYQVVSSTTLDILTKLDSRKVRNILAHHQVALTIYDRATMQTLQLQGIASLETEQQPMRNKVFAALNQPRMYGERMQYPPVTTFTQGAYTVVRIVPYACQFFDFRQEDQSLASQANLQPKVL